LYDYNSACCFYACEFDATLKEEYRKRGFENYISGEDSIVFRYKLEGGKKKGTGEDCIIKSFVITTFQHIS
jgi:hypothetical protein